MGRYKARRVLNMWVNTPAGRMDKCIVGMLYRSLYDDGDGLIGQKLKDELFNKYSHLRPGHGRTKHSVYTRGETVNNSWHEPRENIYTNDKTKPYCGLAARVIASKKPWTVDDLAEPLSDIAMAQPGAVARKNLIEETKREHIRTVFYKYDGKCPCCRTEQIVISETEKKTGALEFDHHFGPHKNGVQFTWPLCKGCHKKWTAGLFDRVDDYQLFEAYQGRRKTLREERAHLIISGAGATTNQGTTTT